MAYTRGIEGESTLIPVDWCLLGAQLATKGSDVQGAFLRSFCKELMKSCGTYHQAEMQLAWVRDELTEDDKELLTMLGVNL